MGVDASLAMCLTARARAGPCVAAGDGSALPFADESFGGVRADRVLQHLAHPVACLREMARVVPSGGPARDRRPRPGDAGDLRARGPPALTDRVKALRRDVGYRNGRFVTTLPEELDRMGFVEIATRAFPLALTRADLAFGLPGWPRLWQREGGFTDEEIAQWELAVAQSPIVYALLYFTVTATKP